MKLPGFARRAARRNATMEADDFWQRAGQLENLLYRAAWQYTGNRFDAEDLVQETLLAAFGSLHQLRDPRKLKRWLFVILRNRFLKRVRREAPADGQSYDDGREYLDALGRLAAHEDAHQVLERKAAAEYVHRGLHDLPEPYQSVLILYYLKEFSYQEIADMLDIPLGTVMSRLSRGKRRLKTAIMRNAFRDQARGKLIPLARKG